MNGLHSAERVKPRKPVPVTETKSKTDLEMQVNNSSHKAVGATSSECFPSNLLIRCITTKIYTTSTLTDREAGG